MTASRKNQSFILNLRGAPIADLALGPEAAAVEPSATGSLNY